MDLETYQPSFSVELDKALNGHAASVGDPVAASEVAKYSNQLACS